MNDVGGDEQRAEAAPRAVVSSTVAVPPPRDRVVARPRLDPLFAPERRRLTLVVANAGWGKTSAVRDWATRTHRRVAWVTLEHTDDEPARFWSCALDAIGTAVPGVASDAARLLHESRGRADAFVGVLANELARLDGTLTLVIDDVHVLADARVLEGLAYLVEHAPPQLLVVLVGREQPRLPIARWRARGMTAEVSEAQLAFRVDEAAALLATFDGVDVADEEVVALTDQTEGWPMGICLAALTLQRHGALDSALALRVGVARGARFLVHEVVGREAADLRGFLYATSVVERLNASLAQALTGRDDASAMLRAIEDRRLFLVPLDTRREWFRYHHLFREALLDELVARDEARSRELHASAARWFARNGDTRLAVSHLLDAGRTDAAFDLAVQTPAGARLDRDGDWLDLVPPEFVAADFRRIERFAIALVHRTRFADAYAWLPLAELAADQGNERSARQDDTIVAMRSHLHAIEGDATGAVASARKLLPFDFDRVSDGLVFERLPVNLARSYLVLGDVAAARRIVEPLADRTDISDEARLVVVPAVLANVDVAEGRLRGALARATRALLHAGHGEPNFGELDARLARATVFVERGDVAAAEEEFADLWARALELDSVLHCTFGELLAARAAAFRGDTDAASVHVAQARASATRARGDTVLGRVDAVEAALCIRHGDPERAAALTARLPFGTDRALLEIRLDLARRPSVVRARLAELRLAGARDQIVRQLLLARAASDVATAQRHRRSAVVLAAREGFVLVFAEEDVPLSGRDGDAAPAEALSERELAVLQQLGTPASNSVIASALFISPNTLKTHLRSIYHKLGVASREEAVESARARGLL